VILVVDGDDRETRAFHFAGLSVRQVVVEPGLPMGALNMAGYEAATGAYLMLLNDDVIVRTAAWDEQILAGLRSFPDGIVLAHVNDTLLREALCTFPIVSRTFCELAGGICPRTYARYRIDDHIEDVFNLLGVLGERRTLYFPDVVFEHLNYVVQPAGHREYHSNGKTLADDAPRFEALAPARKEVAIRLKQHIVDQARTNREQLWRLRLESVRDSFLLRVPERLRVESTLRSPASASTPVTIGLLTPDCSRRHFHSCHRAIRRTAARIELVVVEHGASGEFHLGAELNRLVKTARTRYVALMDDTTLVRRGWLDELLAPMCGNVGVVSLAAGPGHALMVCQLPLLIDRDKCRERFFDESHRTATVLMDFGLRCREAGIAVATVPPSCFRLRDRHPIGPAGQAHHFLDDTIRRASACLYDRGLVGLARASWLKLKRAWQRFARVGGGKNRPALRELARDYT